MSIVSAAYTGPTPVIKTPVQPPMEEGDPCPLDLSTGSVAVAIVNEETAAELQGGQVTVSRTQSAAIRAIFRANENESTPRDCLRVAGCYVLGMIPSGILIGFAQDYPVDSVAYNTYFWIGIALIPTIALRICCGSLARS